MLRAAWKLGPTQLCRGDIPERGKISQGVITLSNALLEDDDVGGMLATLVHETRHALQFAVLHGGLDHPAGDDGGAETLRWEEALLSYASDRDDFTRYAYNALEVDARGASAAVVTAYWNSSYTRHRFLR